MKHWLIGRLSNRATDWMRVVENINIAHFMHDGEPYMLPANIDAFPPKFQDPFRDIGPKGNILRLFNKDVMNWTITSQGEELVITQPLVPTPLQDASNRKAIDLELIENLLEQHEWVALITDVGPGAPNQSTLQMSQYVVRGLDKDVFIKNAVTNTPLTADQHISAIVYLVAYRLEKSNAYVMVANHDILSVNTEMRVCNDHRTITTSNSQHINLIDHFIKPIMPNEVVAQHVIVDEDYLDITLFEGSALRGLYDAVVNNIDFKVKSSWEVEVIGNKVRIKKQQGLGFVKISLRVFDFTKPYIFGDYTNTRESLSLEYILLGV